MQNKQSAQTNLKPFPINDSHNEPSSGEAIHIHTGYSPPQCDYTHNHEDYPNHNNRQDNVMRHVWSKTGFIIL